MARNSECFALDNLAFPIVLTQQGKDNFTVAYGKQVKPKLSYAEACLELGIAIMHALSCNGEVDNRRKGER